MKLTWKTFRWIILAGILPALFHKSRYLFFYEYNLDINLYRYIATGLVISITHTVFIGYLIFTEIIWLEKKLPWKTHPFYRVIAEFFLTNITVTLCMVGMNLIMFQFDFVTGINELNQSPKEEFFEDIILGVVMNLILVSMVEGSFFFNQWKNSLLHSERLEREKTQSQLEALKNQVNPHFLFNSLNVLSSLVHADAYKAEEFIDEFASVYRYILNIQDKTVVSLQEELRFLDSFIFLQKIRFQEGLKIQMHIEAEQLNKYLPPLALQLLVENAIKHNVVGKEKPLNIRIFTINNELFIVNNLQIRQDKPEGTEIGLKNLRERYFHLAGLQPKFEIKDNEFVAQIPLFDGEVNEDLSVKHTEQFKCKSFNKGVLNKLYSKKENK